MFLRYSLKSSGQTVGPFSRKQVVGLIRTNQVNRSPLVKSWAFGGWVPITDHPDFAGEWIPEETNEATARQHLEMHPPRPVADFVVWLGGWVKFVFWLFIWSCVAYVLWLIRGKVG